MLRFLPCKLFSSLPFHSQHLFAFGKARMSSLRRRQHLLVLELSSTLSPCLYKQIHPQLLNSQHHACSTVFVPVLQGVSILLSIHLKRANTQMHQKHRLALEQLSLAFKEHTGLQKDHIPDPPHISRSMQKVSHETPQNTIVSSSPF